MRNSTILLLILSFVFFSCNDRSIFSQYKPIKNSLWKAEDSLHFDFAILDTISTHNLFIHIRNDDNFPFSNLFLITTLEDPRGQLLKDTLEYIMARPTGEWLGQGSGSLKENKLWFRENMTFPHTGTYRLTITHAMRKNGEVKGLNNLNGINDVGLEVEQNSL